MPYVKMAPFDIVGVILAVCFWRMHVIHVERYGDFVANTIAFKNDEIEKES
jgi:hypothetical protein